MACPSAKESRFHVPDRCDGSRVAACHVRCATSFGPLVDRYYGAICSFLTVQSCDVELARDLTQETFLAAFQHRDQLTDEAAFGAWLYQIARNKLRSHWRSPVQRFVVLDWLELRAGVGNVMSQPARSIETVLERVLIQQVYDRLSPASREVLLLYHLAGFSTQEIAMILAISRTAAQRRLNRAEAQFRSRYQELNTNYPPVGDCDANFPRERNPGHQLEGSEAAHERVRGQATCIGKRS